MQIRKSSLLLILLAATGVIALGVWTFVGGEKAVPAEPGVRTKHAKPIADVGHRQPNRPEHTAASAGQADEAPLSPDEDAPALTEEEIREAAESKLVEEFEALTDQWLQPKPSGVSMADIDKFVQTFRKVPPARRDECIHRALNLLPDGNVMLLAGVLMDKEMDKEIVDTVYNDILNRAEEVKRPILLEIFKDKTHPCWADTAWILDVTGALPSAK